MQIPQQPAQRFTAFDPRRRWQVAKAQPGLAHAPRAKAPAIQHHKPGFFGAGGRDTGQFQPA